MIFVYSDLSGPEDPPEMNDRHNVGETLDYEASYSLGSQVSQSTSNIAGLRVWDKSHNCPYYEQPQAKFADTLNGTTIRN